MAPQRKKWNTGDMESAIRSVLAQEHGYLKAAKPHKGQKWIVYGKCFLWAHEVQDAAIDECTTKKKYICTKRLNSES